MLESFDDKKEIYIEPFLGSGIVLINVKNQHMYDEYFVNDVNPDVINFYKVVVNKLNKLIIEITKITKEFNDLNSVEEKENYYYRLRDKYNLHRNEDDIRDATMFWCLMKLCFNGVYRINKSGKYNVPFGKKIN